MAAPQQPQGSLAFLANRLALNETWAPLTQWHVPEAPTIHYGACTESEEASRRDRVVPWWQEPIKVSLQGEVKFSSHNLEKNIQYFLGSGSILGVPSRLNLLKGALGSCPNSDSLDGCLTQGCHHFVSSPSSAVPGAPGQRRKESPP